MMPRYKRKSLEQKKSEKKLMRLSHDSSSTLLNHYFSDQLIRQSSNSSIWRGTLHQDSPLFSADDGNQAQWICLTFLIEAFENNLHDLNACFIDSLLRSGSFLYNNIVKMSGKTSVDIKDIETVVYRRKYYQIAMKREPQQQRDCLILDKTSLDTRFEQSYFIVLQLNLTSGCSYLCALHQRKENLFFVFDPHSANGKGIPTHAGSASLLQFRNTEMMYDHISKLSRSLNASNSETMIVQIGVTTASIYRRFYNKCVKQKQRRNEKDSLSEEALEHFKVQESGRRQAVRLNLPESKKAEMKRRESAIRKRKKDESDMDKKQEIKEKDSNARKRRRLELDEDSRIKIKKTETIARQKHRGDLDEETQKGIRQTETVARKRHRSELNDEARKDIREKETTARKQHRSDLDEETQKDIRQRETIVRQQHRSELDADSRKEIRQTDTTARKQHRSEIDKETQKGIKHRETNARQQHRCNLDEGSRKDLQKKDTTARRQHRSDLHEDTQKSIRQRETNARQQQRSDLDDGTRKGIRQRETNARQQQRSDLDDGTRKGIRQRETNARQQQRSDLDDGTRKGIRQRETNARQQQRSDLDDGTRKGIRQRETNARQQQRSDLDDGTRKGIRQRETNARQQQRSDLDDGTRKGIRQRETNARQQQRSDLDDGTRKGIRQRETNARQQHRSDLDDGTRKGIRQRETNARQQQRSELDESSLQRIREANTDAKRSKRREYATSYEEKFKGSIKEFPVYFCCCCHRANYRQLVQVLSEEKYFEMEKNLLTLCLTKKLSFDNKRYICTCCHSNLMKSRIPAMAVANNLYLHCIPEELKSLGELECILIAQRIIFFKMVNLPRDRQKGVVGSFVNIPSDAESVCASLPRTPDQSGIIALKLKRKISYKGHHLHQNIRPDRVVSALNWLVQNNNLYKNIKVRDDWIQKCQEENEELWNSLFVEDEHYTTKHGETDSQSNEGDEGEEDVQQKVRGLQYDTCLHPNNTIASAQKEYCIAPGEGKSPLDPFLDTKCEALAFPHLFPTAKGTFLGDNEEVKRSAPLTAKKYFIQRVTNADSRFASSVPYLFFALNVCEKQQIQNSVNIALRKARRMDVTVGQLKDPDRMHEIFVKDQAFQFLQQVRGSPTYWQHAQYELLAMVRAKGVFTRFLTLSCADLQWPETIQSIALQYGTVLSEEDVQNLSYEEKCCWLRQNPVVAARQFDHRLQSFFRDVIQSPAAPIGKVTHYFQRTEFQLRGSPHCHAVLWVENAPDIMTSDDKEICNWIDTYITCEIPLEDDPLHDEVLTKQMHTHSVACKKHGTTCRFHYPKPPSDKTLLSKPSDDESEVHFPQSKVQETLFRVNKVLTDDSVHVPDLTLSDILQLAQVSENDYYRALQYSKSGKSVVLKRKTSCLNVNNYNKDILRIWKANMDLQFVCDPYACITYISAYVTKDERELSQMLKDAAKEMKNSDVKTRLRKVGNVYLSNREISAQEAAYRLLSIPLKRCSSRIVWIPTDFPEDRIGILKPQCVLDELDESDTEVYALGIVDKYQKRPDIPIISQLCLWEFAAWYAHTSHTDEPKANVQNDDSLPKTIKLKDGKGMMKKCETPAIPRYRVFSINKESEKFYHQQLMLFIPWRDETGDLRDDSSELPYQTMFEKKRKAVTETKLVLNIILILWRKH